MWLEGRFYLEFLRLIRDPVFRGVDVPSGSRKPVLLIPGFLAGDWTLRTQYDWLRRVGYRPRLAGLSFNVMYSEVMLRPLIDTLFAMNRKTGARVSIVGAYGLLAHREALPQPLQLVGLVARGHALDALAYHHRLVRLGEELGELRLGMPDLVEQVITRGSPLSDPFDVHPLTMAGVHAAHLFNAVRYRHPASVEMRFLRDLRSGPRVPTTSIYSRSDGVVNWKACLRPDVNAIEVRGSHVGLALNPEVYRILSHLLPAPWRTD